MGKNRMSEVAILLGVELDEEFEIDEYGAYVLTSRGLVARGGEGIQGMILTRLLTGDLTPKHKPWKPKMGEVYYFVDENGVVRSDIFDRITRSILLYKIGNCYRTCKEAVDNRNKWRSFYAFDKRLDV